MISIDILFNFQNESIDIQPVSSMISWWSFNGIQRYSAEQGIERWESRGRSIVNPTLRGLPRGLDRKCMELWFGHRNHRENYWKIGEMDEHGTGYTWVPSPCHDFQGTVAPIRWLWLEKREFPSRRRFPWRVHPLAVARNHLAPRPDMSRPRVTAASWLMGARQAWNVHHSIQFPMDAGQVQCRMSPSSISNKKGAISTRTVSKWCVMMCVKSIKYLPAVAMWCSSWCLQCRPIPWYSKLFASLWSRILRDACGFPRLVGSRWSGFYMVLGFKICD